MSESESRPRYAGPAIVRPGEATGRAAQPIPRLISRPTVLNRINRYSPCLTTRKRGPIAMTARAACTRLLLPASMRASVSLMSRISRPFKTSSSAGRWSLIQ